MRHSSRLAVVACFLLLGACSTSGSGVDVRLCNAIANGNGATLDARFVSHADKPVRRVSISVDFYHDFKFQRATGIAEFSPVLDPGQTRDASFPLETSGSTSGPAMHCTVTGTVYGDGTTAGSP